MSVPEGGFVTVAGVTGAAATVTTVVAVACPFLPDAVAV